VSATRPASRPIAQLTLVAAGDVAGGLVGGAGRGGPRPATWALAARGLYAKRRHPRTKAAARRPPPAETEEPAGGVK
jgi:hypothetical protein